jgi:hypothetical protein
MGNANDTAAMGPPLPPKPSRGPLGRLVSLFAGVNNSDDAQRPRPTHDDGSGPWIEARDKQTGETLPATIRYVGPTENAPKTNVPSHDRGSGPTIEVRDKRTGENLPATIRYVGPTKNAPKTNIP